MKPPRLRTRISETADLGPVRIRLSLPLLGGGQPWLTSSTRTGRRGRTSISVPLGGRKGGRR